MQYNLLELFTIDKRSTVDYDQQLKANIKALILDQTFYYHTALPSVDALAKHLSIDDSVVESTYNQLIKERYLTVDKSKNYQVSFFELTNYFFERNTAVYDAIKTLGLEPSIECLVKKEIHLNDLELSKMGFIPKDGNSFMYINRIYKGDDQPIMILENYIPLSVFPDIVETFKGCEPLNAFLKKQYGIRAEVSKRVVKTVNLNERLASLLNERKNAASIQSTNHIYDKFGRLIDYGQSHSVGNYYFQILTKKEDMQGDFTK